MSDIVERNAITILEAELAAFESETGIDLKAADPRRLLLQAYALLRAHQAAAIDWSGKQNLVSEVSSVHIEGLGDLWGLTKTTETVEEFRTAIEDEPGEQVGGPEKRYADIAKESSALCLDASCVGDDPPTSVMNLFITQVDLITPSPELIAIVNAAVQDEKIRVVGDQILVGAPTFASFNVEATYYIARSRADSEDEIIDAVETAYEAWKDWQQGKIGRDINVSELEQRIMNAGAKRLVIDQPAYQALDDNECARINYDAFVYGGIEED